MQGLVEFPWKEGWKGQTNARLGGVSMEGTMEGNS
jgi:hypothetical protein